MTATVVYPNPTMSFLTLALLESTGWYTRVSYELGSFVNFGRKSGCAMLEPENCEPADYCEEVGEKGCDSDNIAGSHCTRMCIILAVRSCSTI
jgi:hypothetical protein